MATMPNVNFSGLLSSWRFGPKQAGDDTRWQAWRQGDFVSDRAFPRQRHIAERRSIRGYAVVSQTCDVVLSKRPTVTFAPVRTLDESELRTATRDNPRYLQFPHLAESLYLDLSHVFSVQKRRLSPGLGRTPIPDSLQRKLSNTIARWFGRFPFPDEVVPWLQPLEKVIRDKHDRPASAIGRVLQEVVEIRVESNWGDVANREVTLHFILKSGAITPVDFFSEDGESRFNSDLSLLRQTHGTDLTKVAESILAAQPQEKTELWTLFADLLAERCRPSATELQNSAVRNAVNSILSRVCDDHDFTLAEWRRSERLDVDYLSAQALA